MKSLENMNCRAIDGRQQIVLDAPHTLYLVKQGKVFLHFAEIDAEGFNKRKHYIETIEPGQVFSGCAITVQDRRYALVATGESDSAVYEIETDQETATLSDTPENESDFNLTIIEKANAFYARMMGEGTALQNLITLVALDAIVIGQNNQQLLAIPES